MNLRDFEAANMVLANDINNDSKFYEYMQQIVYKPECETFRDANYDLTDVVMARDTVNSDISDLETTWYTTNLDRYDLISTNPPFS